MVAKTVQTGWGFFGLLKSRSEFGKYGIQLLDGGTALCDGRGSQQVTNITWGH